MDQDTILVLWVLVNGKQPLPNFALYSHSRSFDLHWPLLIDIVSFIEVLFKQIRDVLEVFSLAMNQPFFDVSLNQRNFLDFLFL